VALGHGKPFGIAPIAIWLKPNIRFLSKPLNFADSKTVLTALSNSVSKVRNSILKREQDLANFDNLIRSSVHLLAGPSLG
jgi:hypothetical protein